MGAAAKLYKPNAARANNHTLSIRSVRRNKERPPDTYAVQSAQKINRVTRRTKFVTHLAHFVRYAREVRYFARKVRYFAREVRYLTRAEILL